MILRSTINYSVKWLTGKRDKYSIEKRYIRKDGAVIWVDLSVSLVRNNKGDPLYTIGIIQEITERKQAAERLHIREERYRSLVDTQNSLISRADLNGNFTFVNDAYCKAFGKKREELIGHSFLLNVLPEDREMALKAHNQLYDPPHRYTVEDRSMTTAGLRWLRWEGSVVRDNNGNIIELQGVGTDITEQKQNEIQLQDYLGKLRNTVEGTIETIALIVEARDPTLPGTKSASRIFRLRSRRNWVCLKSRFAAFIWLGSSTMWARSRFRRRFSANLANCPNWNLTSSKHTQRSVMIC